MYAHDFVVHILPAYISMVTDNFIHLASHVKTPVRSYTYQNFDYT